MSDIPLTKRLIESKKHHSFTAKMGDLGFASAMGKIADYQIQKGKDQLEEKDLYNNEVTEPINKAVSDIAKSLGLDDASGQEFWMGKYAHINTNKIRSAFAQKGVLEAANDLITNNKDLRQIQQEYSEFSLGKEYEGIDIYSNSSLNELSLESVLDANRARKILPLTVTAGLAEQIQKGYNPKEVGRQIANNEQLRPALKDSFIESLEADNRKNPNNYK